jgi:hypothetical protein
VQKPETNLCPPALRIIKEILHAKLAEISGNCMKDKVFSLVVLLFVVISSQAVNPVMQMASNSTSLHMNVDSLMQTTLKNDTVVKPHPTSKTRKLNFRQLAKNTIPPSTKPINNLVVAPRPVDTVVHFSLPDEIPTVKVDSLLLLANPFFIELVYNGMPINLKADTQTELKNLIYGQKIKNHSDVLNTEKQLTPEEIVVQLRDSARNQITRKAADLYIMTFNELPDPSGNRSRYIGKDNASNVHLINVKNLQNNQGKLEIKNPQIGPWQYKLNSLAQFSESMISSNWYQGGNSNLAVLGILSGQLTYDNKKSIQWDNTLEWRMGFNSVAGDTIHWLSTNDDILKINSKLGVKAAGNFFYSGSVDFSTQFFNSYKGINSYELKAAFLAPVRLNIGIGMDYKFEKIFSLMVSPFSYKYIYVNPVVESASGKQINPNLFGIKTGQNVLSEVGSSIKATYSAPITNEIQLDSKFSFYTNYQKVEIDWEIVANMTINRYLSTRISLNPRYDNTVIEKNGSVARMQFKQFLSVGFSHKLM